MEGISGKHLAQAQAKTPRAECVGSHPVRSGASKDGSSTTSVGDFFQHSTTLIVKELLSWCPLSLVLSWALPRRVFFSESQYQVIKHIDLDAKILSFLQGQ